MAGVSTSSRRMGALLLAPVVVLLLSSAARAGNATGASGGLLAVEMVDAEASGAVSAAAAAGGEMESLLHWAVTHSDPEQLHQQALAAGDGGGAKMTLEQLKELAAKRAKIREAIDAFNEEPTETELMKEAIASMNAYAPEGKSEFSQNEEELSFIENNLRGLQILVEPIDNANDLKVLGALGPLSRLLRAPLRVRLGAAAVIGTAASNNPTFQGHLLEAVPNIMEELLPLLDSREEAEVTRGLYAVASMSRNTVSAQTAFFEAGGVKALAALAKRAVGARQWKVANRCMQLTSDLAATGAHVRKLLLKGGDAVHGPLAIISAEGTPLDALENALFVLEALAADNSSRSSLQLAGTEAALSGLEKQLSSWNSEDEDEREYVGEVLGLASKVKQDIAEGYIELSNDEL